MKERFSKIFELWNQRNTEYYQKAFDRLEKEKKITFNFAAGFFPILWLVFRKMYGWAMLFTLLYGGILALLHTFYQSPISELIGSFLYLHFSASIKTLTLILAGFYLVVFIGFGFFGNNLYCKHVKSKVTKGYAEISDYNPVDPVWSLLYSALGSLLKMLSIPVLVLFLSVPSRVMNDLSFLFDLIIIAIVWTVDYRKFHSQESLEPLAITEESVNRYLEKSDLKQMISAICGLVLISVLSIMSIASLKTLGKKVLNQLDAMSAMDKGRTSSNNSNSSVTKILDDKEIKKQLDEIDKLNKKILEKKKSGKVDESLKKDQEALVARWAELAKYAKKKNSQKVPKKTVNHPR